VAVVAPPNAPEAPRAERSVFVVGSAVNQMVIAGATIVRPNADLRETFGVKRGVLVLDVARGTPAYASGLKGGDIILSAGRFTATTPSSIQRAMQSADERSVQLRIIRKQKPQTVVLRW
jgi:S1-C subfamily serine protease